MTEKHGGSLLGTVIALVGSLLSILFLANPGLGLFFEIPDNIPVVGNLDEVVVTGILVACLSKLGIHVVPNLDRRKQHADENSDE